MLPTPRLPVTERAKALGVPRQTLHAILTERAAVELAMGARHDNLCGKAPGLLRMQQERSN